jgi:hypothetical protein
VERSLQAAELGGEGSAEPNPEWDGPQRVCESFLDDEQRDGLAR